MSALSIKRYVPTPRDAQLQDRWDPEAGLAFLSGVQGVIRGLFDQRREDIRHGIESAAFVSGYQGSPLGGLDTEFAHQRRQMDELSVRFQAGVNEELAATSVWGSQMAHLTPGSKVTGVLGMWFGKNPGLDRAADALRHATVAGVGPSSGAVAVVGDDPACKSSTLPSLADRTLSGLMLPVLAPATVEDVPTCLRHAFRMSRAAGLWTALKLVADVADATANVPFAGEWAPVKRLVEFELSSKLLGERSLVPEQHLLEHRLPAAVRYAREHRIDRITARSPKDRMGIVAPGATYAELLRAFDAVAFDAAELARLGVRVLKLGLTWPIDERTVAEFADGLDQILVLEDKLPFVEDQIRVALSGQNSPEILGKRTERLARHLPLAGALRADHIVDALHELTGRELVSVREPEAVTPLSLVRTPSFCSGCPHSTSTRESESTLVGAGIGCHVMLVTETQSLDRTGTVMGLTQMGGEGAQWIGMAPFTSDRHLVQNVGDGTFHHSGSLALRAAVAAGVNVTYKLLYNDAVAMTGGQRIQGVLPVPELTRMLEAEGVRRTVITTEDVDRYRKVRLAPNATVRHRDDLQRVLDELRALDGVTVLVHDQMCAAEKRRLRKRGKLKDPPQRAWINERVCEGCGDCGEASGCMSVEPVETEFGRKTRIHQASCNKDMTCLKGDCPSFVTVVPSERKRTLRQPPAPLPEPALTNVDDVTVRLIGIGGTGVVTVSQVLSMAAHLDGRFATGLDQTGLSQKGGAVISDIRITSSRVHGTARAGRAGVDVLLVLDVLTAAAPSALSSLDRERTRAAISTSAVPTAAMVTHVDVRFPDVQTLVRRIARRTLEPAPAFDAQRLAEVVFSDHMPANLIMLGAAWQLGVVPVSWDALSRAIHLNGGGVETNLLALRWGRTAVAHPELVSKLLDGPARPRVTPPPWLTEAVSTLDVSTEVADVVLTRACDMLGWGGPRAARTYLDRLSVIAAREQAAVPGSTRLTASVARQLHRLMAYKDEYEVARLHLLPEEVARREAVFGAGAQVTLHLHPPALRALGLERKLRLRRSAPPLLRALRASRRLRGTRLDPFGFHPVRRLERELPGEYLASLTDYLERLSPGTIDAAVERSDLADLIRGYEDVKLRTVARWREALSESRV
jgi:indolepyruvate ferredoxin oxidoreductase